MFLLLFSSASVLSLLTPLPLVYVSLAGNSATARHPRDADGPPREWPTFLLKYDPCSCLASHRLVHPGSPPAREGRSGTVPNSETRLVVITGGCLVLILQVRVMGGGVSSREDSMFITCAGAVLWRRHGHYRVIECASRSVRLSWLDLSPQFIL